MNGRKLKTISLLGAFGLALSIFVPAMPAEAAGEIYVNDSQSVLSMDIGSAYAVGSSGTALVGDTYVLTDSGTVKLGQGSARVPSGEPDGSTIRVSVNTVRVGLYFGDTAQQAPALENKVGSGYKFGYYDSSRSFIELGETSVSSITMVPDINVTVIGGVVGCYHIRLPGSYPTFAAAKSAAAGYVGGFPAYYNGSFYAMVGQYTSSVNAQLAQSNAGIPGEVFTASNRAVAVTQTGTTSILFEFDYGTTASLSVRPISSGKAETWYKEFSNNSNNYAYYGDFEFYRYHSDKLTVIGVLNVEDYVKGVIPYEMSASWPLEALKAQAVCARTYFARNLNRYSQYNFDVTNTASSQVYRGINLANANSNAAVEATAGEYVTYNGQLCETLYYSSNGGGSENSENVFVTAQPYLRGVLDPYEADTAADNKYSSWTKTLKKSAIAQLIVASGKTFGTFSAMSATYSDTGNVVGLTFTDTSGRTVSFTGSACFSFCYSTSRMSLLSIHFTFADKGDSIEFKGSGWGHSVGMSQFGACSMAKYHGFNYRQIIRYYYTGASISKGV